MAVGRQSAIQNRQSAIGPPSCQIHFSTDLPSGPILGDGALGTMLHARGASLEQCLEELTLTRPDWVRDIHLGYIRAGAEVIQANTFAANRLRLGRRRPGRESRATSTSAGSSWREAREISGQAVSIAGSVGPLGRRAHGSNGLRERLGRRRVRGADRGAVGSRRRSPDPRNLLQI